MIQPCTTLRKKLKSLLHADHGIAYDLSSILFNAKHADVLGLPVSQTEMLVMVWWLSQGIIPTGVAQEKPPKWLEIWIRFQACGNTLPSVRHGYIQVGISYWAAAMVLVSDG